ncbi:phosphatidate cytidylyltransferase [Oleiharenicola lentus]|uniref:phosphatidate cytidylyltransferase n=1 Tax=Oleiharenicola lentus TaxID=2508720 RepID=UPI003F66626A
MAKRIFSTLLLWGTILGGLYLFGAHAAIVMLTLLTALTLHEFYGMTAKMGARPFHWMGVFIAALMVGAPYYISYFTGERDVGGIPTLLLIAALIISCYRVLGERDTSNRVETIASTVGGLLFIPFMLQFLSAILMRDADSGDNLALCLWLIAVSKFCDVGALLTGLAFGKHKMCPTISPKKTWEGAVGGVLISAGLGATIAFFASARLPEAMTPLIAALIAVPLAITTIVSDLIESAIKRRADTKDTGALIPGIGGAFDLTDSLILTSPLAFFIFEFLQ